MALSLRQGLFVGYYLGECQGNATRAAALAGYPHPHVAGSRLLENVKVRDAIDARLDESAMPAREVLARLSVLARTTLADVLAFDPDAPPDDIPPIDLRKARRRGRLGNIRKLRRVSRTIPRGKDQPPEVEVTVDVEMHDPHKALALLAKYHRLVDGGEDEGGDLTKMSEEQLEALARKKGRR